MPRQSVSSDKTPRPAGPYSAGVAWDRLVFTAGQVGVDPATGKSAGGWRA